MKITSIKPNFFDTVYSDAMEPLVFAILKSVTPEDVEVVLYDDRRHTSRPVPHRWDTGK